MTGVVLSRILPSGVTVMAWVFGPPSFGWLLLPRGRSIFVPFTPAVVMMMKINSSTR